MNNQIAQANNKIAPFIFKYDPCLESRPIPLIDSWVPDTRDFVYTKDTIYMRQLNHIMGIYTNDSINFNSFFLSPRRCYNKPKTKMHFCHYIAYFNRFFDPDQRYLYYVSKVKMSIDYNEVSNNGTVYEYTKENFVEDIKRYFLSDYMYEHMDALVRANYNLNLSYVNNTNPALQYNNNHGVALMTISMFTKLLIPLISHYIYKKNIVDNNEMDKFVSDIFGILFDRYPDMDLESKLYETAITTMNRDKKVNGELWTKCEIKGINTITKALDAVNTLKLQVLPKYIFDSSMVTYNFNSIRNVIKYSIDVGYEYQFVQLSSSKREGEDATSQVDKYEAATAATKKETIPIMQQYIHDKAIQLITNIYGPFDPKEIRFYYNQLSKGGNNIIHPFQMGLIKNLFGKYYETPEAAMRCNWEDYIKLVIAAKRRVESTHNIIVFSQIISGRFIKVPSRSSLNKKELIMLENSNLWEKVKYKYPNPAIHQDIKDMLGRLLNSEIDIIQYDAETGGAGVLNGTRLPINNQDFIEEFLYYVLMV